MKRGEFFQKNVSGPSNPPEELAQNASKKNPFRTNYSSIFPSKVQNLTVFSIIYMIRIRFFGPRELNQNYFSGEQYILLEPSCLTSRTPQHGECLLAGRWTRSLGPWWPGPRWSAVAHDSVKKLQAVAGSGLEAAGGAVAAAWRGRTF